MCSAPNVYMFVYILIGTHMVPLIATATYGETSAEMVETVTDPKTIPSTVFQNWAGGKKLNKRY